MGTELVKFEFAESTKIIALKIAEKVPESSCTDLVVFIDRLLIIRESKSTFRKKLRDTFFETLNIKVIWPTLQVVWAELRDRVWARSSPNLKIGVLASALGLLFFGGSQAGVAALGGAIAVPLWVVFGAGAMYANHIREALINRLKIINAPLVDL